MVGLPSNYCDGHSDSKDIFSFLNTILSGDGSNLNVCHINARSISPHISDITSLLTKSDLHVCAVSESFLKPGVLSCFYDVPGFRIFRNDRLGRGGGGVPYMCRVDFPLK